MGIGGAARARISLLLAALFFLLASAPGHAAVVLSFYSKELGATFPHAFIRLEGITDATGEPVDTNFGFTAKTVSPAILMGSVGGEIVNSKPSYVAKSDRHFSFALSDEEYATVLRTVEKWRNFKQPSYNLNRRNCVFFVADMAAVLGMKADTPKELMKKPRSYIQSLLRANREWLEKRGASIAD
ncbi:MAG: hypothetical protein JWN69_1070 [Alphaproteobacteria bacterium]|nr:hypothetical protein [Alphaproteobacteria bacterium]